MLLHYLTKIDNKYVLNSVSEQHKCNVENSPEFVRWINQNEKVMFELQKVKIKDVKCI